MEDNKRKYIVNLIIFIIILITLNSCADPEEINAANADINSRSVTEAINTDSITAETTSIEVNTEIGNLYIDELSKEITIIDGTKKLSEAQTDEIETFNIIRTFYMNPTGDHDESAGQIYIEHNGQKYCYDEIIKYEDLEPDEYKYNGRVYGNYDYMQKTLHRIFTDSMVDRFFSYEMPCGYIHRDNKIYAYGFTGSAIAHQKFSELTVMEATDKSVTFAFDYLPMDQLDPSYNMTQMKYKSINIEVTYP